jgi:predicted peptidoglycan binding protein
MAVFETSYFFMLSNEDPHHLFQTVPDEPGKWAIGAKGRYWVGASSISGINSYYFPAQFRALSALDPAKRGPLVEQFYQTEFWNPWFQQVASDGVAMRVFDAGVDMGRGTAVRLLQVSINSFRIPSSDIDTDGDWGPITVAAANDCQVWELVGAFQQARCDEYREIVARNPSKEIYLDQWLERAQK